MNCPRHQAELEDLVINEHMVDPCPDCTGLWIPTSSIDKLLGAGQMLQLSSLCSVKLSKLHRPARCGLLHEGRIGPVTLDLCQKCHGLWLDPGELESLRQRTALTPHQATASDVEFHQPVSASSQLILDGLAIMLFH